MRRLHGQIQDGTLSVSQGDAEKMLRYIPGGFIVATTASSSIIAASPVATKPWQPITDIGDVVIQHVAPKMWVPCAITQSGDLNGRPTTSVSSRSAALAAARALLLPDRRIYIRHHDDAEWEEVGNS